MVETIFEFEDNTFPALTTLREGGLLVGERLTGRIRVVSQQGSLDDDPVGGGRTRKPGSRSARFARIGDDA